MAGPFPGMDPYLELQGPWPDFHNRLIAEIWNEIGARLPGSYVGALTSESRSRPRRGPAELVPSGCLGRPLRDEGSEHGVASATSRSATIEPKLVEILDRDPEEIRITWVEIRSLPELELVTAIEVLSPINKSGKGARRIWTSATSFTRRV